MAPSTFATQKLASRVKSAVNSGQYLHYDFPRFAVEIFLKATRIRNPAFWVIDHAAERAAVWVLLVSFDVDNDFIAKLPVRHQPAETKDPNTLLILAERIHKVVHQLRERRQGRSTLDVRDEYDLQDLFHALLTIHFDDIRREDPATTRHSLFRTKLGDIAEGCLRFDFLHPVAPFIGHSGSPANRRASTYLVKTSG
jgi:hypothetical protein